MIRGLRRGGCTAVPPFGHHDLGTAILIRAWEAGEELFCTSLCLCLSDRLRTQCVTASGLNPDPDLSLPPEYLSTASWSGF